MNTKGLRILSLILIGPWAQALAQSALQADVATLRDQRDKAVAKAVEPIDGIYRKSLEALRLKAIAANDKAALQEIDASIEAISRPAIEPKAFAEFETRLKGTRWSWPEKAFDKEISWFRLNEDGTTTAGWHKGKGTWKVLSDSSIEIMVTKFPTNLVLNFDTRLTRATLAGGDITKVCNRLK